MGGGHMPGAEPRCRDGYKRASHNVGIIGARPWPAPAADLPFNSVRLRRTALRYFGIEPLCCTYVKRLARISRMSPTLLCYTEHFRARWRQRVHCEGRSSRRGCAGAPRGSTSPLVEPVTAATGSCPDAGARGCSPRLCKDSCLTGIGTSRRRPSRGLPFILEMSSSAS